MKFDFRKICITVTVLGGAFLAVYEFFLKGWYGEEPLSGIIDMVISRCVGAVIFIFLLKYLGYNVLKPKGSFGRALLISLPCFAVVLCNPPILGYYTGIATLSYSGRELAVYIAFFALQCIAVATFEEFAFRGVVLLTIMEKRRKNVGQIFLSVLLSAAVFGVVHLLNVFIGAGIGPTLLQIGYSFLIGGMCAFVLIKTANIWLCVALHAIFNFCGTLIETLGTGSWNSLPIIVFTAVLGTAVAIYVIVSMVKLNPAVTDKIYGKNIDSENEYEEKDA